MHSNSTHPVERNKVPSQRATHGADMDRSWARGVSKVRKAQVEKVEHEQKFRKPEMASYEEVYEAEQQQVVGDEVAANVGGGGDVGCVAHVQGVGIGEL